MSSVVSESELSDSVNTNESKENIKLLVKEWIHLNKDIKTKTKRRKEISNVLSSIMKKNNVDAYNLKEEGAGVKYRTQTQRAGISKKMLMQSLTRFFDNNPETAQEATDFIMNARESKIKDVLIGKITPSTSNS